MKIIEKFDILSFAKITCVIYAVIGFLIGFIIELSLLLGSTISKLVEVGVPGASFGHLAILINPLFYAIGGFVAGLVGAFLFNLAAKWVGGIKVELK